jgi:TonB family protein
MFSIAGHSCKSSVKLTTSALVFATILTNSAHDAYARQSEFDVAAARVAERIAKTGRSKVVVADFIGPKDQINQLGVQLADEFSSALRQSLASSGNGFFLTAGLGRSQHNTTSPQCVDCPAPRSIKASTVLLMVTVTTEGRAVDVELLKTSDTRAVKPAMEAVKNWRFLAARGPNGQPIAMRTEIEVHTTDR